MPAPSPRASSGIFLPPKIRRTMTNISRSSGTPIDPISGSPRLGFYAPLPGLSNPGRWRCRRGEDDPEVPLAPRHPGLIEVLQERDGVLAAGAAQLLELPDVDAGVARVPFPEPPLQILERLRMEDLAVRDPDQAATGQQEVKELLGAAA